MANGANQGDVIAGIPILLIMVVAVFGTTNPSIWQI